MVDFMRTNIGPRFNFVLAVDKKTAKIWST